MKRLTWTLGLIAGLGLVTVVDFNQRIHTHEGRLYLAVVIDLFSRQVAWLARGQPD